MTTPLTTSQCAELARYLSRVLSITEANATEMVKQFNGSMDGENGLAKASQSSDGQCEMLLGYLYATTRVLCTQLDSAMTNKDEWLAEVEMAKDGVMPRLEAVQKFLTRK